MKKIIFGVAVALVAFAACKKTPAPVSRVVTVSYPTINVIGSKFSTINVGSPFVDSGATLIDDVTGAQTTIYADTPVSVDPSTPGMYTLTYSAKNANGYGSVTARYVAVTNYADPVDISGSYVRTQNGAKVTVARKSRALYSISDIGAANLGNVGYFAIIDTTKIDFGEQYSETLGAYFDANVSYFHLRTGDTGFSYVVFAPGYGTSTRTFTKQ